MACAVSGSKVFCEKFKKTDNDKTLYSYSFLTSKNSDEATLLFWNWLLYHTKLTPKHAALHNIYQKNSAAFFYDLDNDGIREIIGTHYATSIAGQGNCLLYILKHDEKAKTKYRLISQNLYFDAHKTIQILESKTANYHKIQITKINSNESKVCSFDRKKNYYLQNK